MMTDSNPVEETREMRRSLFLRGLIATTAANTLYVYDVKAAG